MNSPIIAFWNCKGEIHIMDIKNNYEKLINNTCSKRRQAASN
jgi:hypothetical protein